MSNWGIRDPIADQAARRRIEHDDEQARRAEYTHRAAVNEATRLRNMRNELAAGWDQAGLEAATARPPPLAPRDPQGLAPSLTPPTTAGLRTTAPGAEAADADAEAAWRGGPRDLSTPGMTGVRAMSLTRPEVERVLSVPGRRSAGMSFREFTEQELTPEIRDILSRGQTYGQLQVDPVTRADGVQVYRVQRRGNQAQVLSPEERNSIGLNAARYPDGGGRYRGATLRRHREELLRLEQAGRIRIYRTSPREWAVEAVGPLEQYQRPTPNVGHEIARTLGDGGQSLVGSIRREIARVNQVNRTTNTELPGGEREPPLRENGLAAGGSRAAGQLPSSADPELQARVTAAIEGLRITGANRTQGRNADIEGSAPNSEHLNENGATALDFNIGPPGQPRSTMTGEEFSAVAAAIGVPENQLRMEFTDRGDGPHWHAAWGNRASGGGGGGSQQASDVSEPVRYAFSQFTAAANDPEWASGALRRAVQIGEDAQRAAGIMARYGNREGALEQAGIAMNAAAAADMIRQLSAYRSLVVDGNAGPFIQEYANLRGIDPATVAFAPIEGETGGIRQGRRDPRTGAVQWTQQYTAAQFEIDWRMQIDAQYAEQRAQGEAALAERRMQEEGLNARLQFSEGMSTVRHRETIASTEARAIYAAQQAAALEEFGPGEIQEAGDETFYLTPDGGVFRFRENVNPSTHGQRRPPTYSFEAVTVPGRQAGLATGTDLFRTQAPGG